MKLKKVLSIVLVAVMLLSVIPFTAHADSNFVYNNNAVGNLENYVTVVNNKDGTITAYMLYDEGSTLDFPSHFQQLGNTTYANHFSYKLKDQSDYLNWVGNNVANSTVSGHTCFSSYKEVEIYSDPHPVKYETIDITNGKPYTGLYITGHPIGGSYTKVKCLAPDSEYFWGIYDYRNPVPITYNLNGGNIGGNTANKTEYLKSGETLATTFSTPQRTGYYFKGWYTAASGGTKLTASNSTAATTYYAQWEPYSVTLNGGNNATTSGGSVYQELGPAEMTKVTYTANSGYGFKESDFPKSSNGIYASRKSDTTVEVSGVPTSHVIFTVPDAKPRASVTTAPTANELTATGSPQKLVSAGAASGGTMYYAVTTTENTMPAEWSYSETIPERVYAGTYYVWYKVVGDENHSDTTPASVTVTVNKSEASAFNFSFTKVSSADDITAENIDTCTKAEVKSWILENWDDVVNDEESYYYFAFYNSDTGKINVWQVYGSYSKDDFLAYGEWDLYTNWGIEEIKDTYGYGDDYKVYLCTPAAPAEPNNGTNITVADTISENFYIDEEYYGTTYGNDVHVTLNYNHNSNLSETPNFQTETMALSSLPALDDSTSTYDGARMLSVIQAPAQATEDITINVYASEADALAGTNPVDTITYNVYDYCRAILTGEYSDGWKELAETTLDYCAAAQTYFGYNTDNMATKDNGGEYYNSLDSADFSGVASIVKPACIKKASMVAKSDLEINLLSLSSITVTGASMAADEGKDRFSVSNSVNGDYYEVNIKGIVPANMNKTITINTSEGDIVLTANAIMKIMANSSNANLANMAKAMYLYGVAAYNCFD